MSKTGYVETQRETKSYQYRGKAAGLLVETVNGEVSMVKVLFNRHVDSSLASEWDGQALFGNGQALVDLIDALDLIYPKVADSEDSHE
jgi:hypothetical protein